ncbi:MAG: cell division protein FtsZ [Patescibacteria group bacterium]|nr:cell division protein FtsZ [Patescibacteria group bacterium]
MVKKKILSKKKIKPKKKATKPVGKKRPIKKKRSVKSEKEIYQPKIGVIGIGGGGGSIVGEIAKNISKKKIPHSNRVKFIVANVDSQAIKAAPRQAGAFYFGQKTTHGLGCGMNVTLGEDSATREKKRIKTLLKKYDFCILITCLGGGAGSGAAPVFAELSKELGILTMGICTLPFSFEGKERYRIARSSLEKMKTNLNAFVVVPNQRIFKIIDQKTPIQKSLSTMNNILVRSLEGLIETLYSPGLINLDFSDFTTILNHQSGLAYLYSQEFSGSDRANKVVQSVLKNPLINYDITGTERMLFNIAGSKDMKMNEVENISQTISGFNPQAKIIFGVTQDSKHKNKIKITLLAVGCETDAQRKAKILKKEKIEREKKEAEIRLARTEKRIREQKKAEALKRKKEKELQEIREKRKLEKEKADRKKKLEKEKEKERKRLEKEEAERKEKLEKERKIIIKKKILKSKPKVVNKTTVRRNALDLHKQAKEDEQRMLEEERKWDIPAFLREEDDN